MKIQWENPPYIDRPNRYKDRSKYLKEFARILRTKPNNWAVMERPEWLSNTESALNSTARNLNKGRWPGGKGYEAIVAQGKIYVRYIGEVRD